jgi:hypothetical protein
VIAGTAQAQSRDGEGRISIEGGVRSPLDSGFLDEARGDSETIEGGNFDIAPLAILTFSYWPLENLELSLEGGYSRDQITLKNAAPWIESQEMLMAAIRFVPWTHWNWWPYAGAAFGYSLNQLTGTTLPYAEEADGYAGALFVGTGWDLAAHFGLTAEFRYNIASIQVPGFTNAYDVGGPSIMLGFYYTLAKEVDSPATPPSM